MSGWIHLRKLAPIYGCVLAFFLLMATLSSTVTTYVSQNQKPERTHCIVIDAGHGTPDGGATSCTGALECTINLQITKRLDDIMHLLGYKTLMTRSDDNSIFTYGNTIASKKVSDIKNRVNIVNCTENAILISIHQNHFTDGRYSGAQVFYADTPGSEDLGSVVQKSLIQYVDPNNNRAPKKASGIYLMEKINCPGILIECGFLSNPEEATLLEDEMYQKHLSSAIAASVGKYINTISAVS